MKHTQSRTPPQPEAPHQQTGHRDQGGGLSQVTYTPKQVEPILQLSKNTVNALLNSGDLRAVRCGRKWIIPRDAIIEFLSGRNR